MSDGRSEAGAEAQWAGGIIESLDVYQILILLLRILSLICCLISLTLSFTLKLPSSNRMVIQRQRAVSLALLLFLVLIFGLIGHRVILPTQLSPVVVAFGIAWFFMAHLLWTIDEGIEVYRALVKKLRPASSDIGASQSLLLYALSAALALLPLTPWTEDLFKEGYRLLLGSSYVTSKWHGDRKVVLSLLFMIVPSTTVMMVANLTICCLAIWSICKRSKELDVMTNHFVCKESSSLKHALTVLALSSILGLNLGTCVLSFSRSLLVSRMANMSFSWSGVIFLLQFLLCNHTIKETLWKKCTCK